MRIEVLIPGEPVPQGRPRFAKTRYGVHTYEDEKSRAYKERVAACAKAAMRGMEPMEGALRVAIRTYRQYPKKLTKQQREHIGDLQPITRPDVDNLAKAVLDGMNGICYKDDARIVDLKVSKEYSDAPRVEVEITEG